MSLIGVFFFSFSLMSLIYTHPGRKKLLFAANSLIFPSISGKVGETA